MKPKFATKVSLIKSVKGELSVQDQLFVDVSTEEVASGVTQKLDLDQMLMHIYKHAERNKCDKTHF